MQRLTVTPANPDAVPPVDAVMESDDALRVRVPEAFESLSVAGPTAAYEFHARSADGRVAKQCAALACIKNGKLQFIRQGQGKTASGKVLPAITIVRKDGDGHRFTLAACSRAGCTPANRTRSQKPR